MKPSDNKKEHYELIKNYFENDSKINKKRSKKNIVNHKQRKIFDLTVKIMDGILKDNPELNKILDAGCGTADFTFELSTNFTQFKRVVGIDFLKDCIYFPLKKIENSIMSFIQADLLNIPFRKNSFDITICIDVLHHIHRDDFKGSIKELARVTNRYLIIEIRNKKNIFNFWYNHIILPIFYRNLPICTTSIEEVNNIMKDYDFILYLARRIASSRFSCRRLVLVYERIK